MLWTLFLRPAISLVGMLLWANTPAVATAKGVREGRRGPDDLSLRGCVQCPGLRECMADLNWTTPLNGNWKNGTVTSQEHVGKLRVDSTTPGGLSDVKFLVVSVADPGQNRTTGANVNFLTNQDLDQDQDAEMVLNQCRACTYGLIYRTEEGDSSIVCWFPKESPDGLTNGKMPSTGTATSPSSTVDSTSSGTTDARTGSATHTPLGPIIGGIVSGITVLTLAIAGVLWYHFKKKKSNKGQQPAALPVQELPASSPAPLKSARIGSMIDDLPGYTEKNAYLGMQSSTNYSAFGPNAPEKAPVLC